MALGIAVDTFGAVKVAVGKVRLSFGRVLGSRIYVLFGTVEHTIGAVEETFGTVGDRFRRVTVTFGTAWVSDRCVLFVKAIGTAAMVTGRYSMELVLGLSVISCRWFTVCAPFVRPAFSTAEMFGTVTVTSGRVTVRFGRVDVILGAVTATGRHSRELLGLSVIS